MGWRYYVWTMGALMLVLFVLRVFVFHLYESPKYLMGRGRDAEAVDVVHAIARYNGRTSSLTLAMLQEAGSLTPSAAAVKEKEAVRGEAEAVAVAAREDMDTSVRAAVVRRLRMLNADHLRALFKTRKLAYSTSLLITLWGELFLLPLSAALPDHALTLPSRSVHRARVPALQRLHHRVPSDARRAVRRRLT